MLWGALSQLQSLILGSGFDLLLVSQLTRASGVRALQLRTNILINILVKILVKSDMGGNNDFAGHGVPYPVVAHVLITNENHSI